MNNNDSMNSLIKRWYRANRIVGKRFKQTVSPIATFVGFLFMRTVVSAGLAMDVLFFPSLKQKKVQSPIVIVGNPRSGTTFLHRFLADNGFGTGMRVWKMLYPSLTIQKVIQPLLPMLEKISPARHHSSAAHETSLTSMETDDPSFMFRFFDGFFLYGFFYAWSEKDLFSLFDPKVRDTSTRDFDWLEAMWKRNLVGEGKNRVVAKLFSLSLRLPQFLQRFPDAKILYMVRDPLETVPSGMSLVTGVLDGRYGFWKLPQAERQHYIDRMYRALLELSLRFHEDYLSGAIPKEKVYVVTFPRLMNDFENTMNEILAFVGEEAGPELTKTIQDIAAKQRAYKSEHRYDLTKFGLDEDKIRQDYAKIYQTFLSAPEKVDLKQSIPEPAL
ncbi:MAG: sulfotransferase [Pseudomonadales bacterium]|nr:sulfotransferase [Pseudomonadales bacterium]